MPTLQNSSSYYKLAVLAEKLQEYEKAKIYYKNALKIVIQTSDRYNQGKTYGQLGILSETLSEFEQAKQYYLQALAIFVELEKQQDLDLTIENLASLYQKTEDNTILTKVAEMLDCTEAEVRELFDK